MQCHAVSHLLNARQAAKLVLQHTTDVDPAAIGVPRAIDEVRAAPERSAASSTHRRHSSASRDARSEREESSDANQPHPSMLSTFPVFVLEWFVNITHRSTGEVAGDATQVQNTYKREELILTIGIPNELIFHTLRCACE